MVVLLLILFRFGVVVRLGIEHNKSCIFRYMVQIYKEFRINANLLAKNL